MRRWIMAYLKAPITWIVLLFGLCVWGIIEGDRDVSRRCDGIMALASSRRDSLDAQIACEKMHSDHATATAIGVAGGMAAGAAAARSAR